MATACSSGSPKLSTGTPRGFPDSPRNGREAALAFVGVAAFAAGELLKGGSGRTKKEPFGAPSVVAPGKVKIEGPETRMRQALKMPDARIDTIVSITHGMRTTPDHDLVTSLLARTDARVREAIAAWMRSPGRSVGRSGERLPERSSALVLSPREAAGERP
jgi:hypothetical protein